MTAHDSNDHVEPIGLSPEDARILDHLAENGFDPAATRALTGEDRARAERLLTLLSQLEHYPLEPADPLLTDLTLLRIDRHEEELAARLRMDAAATTPAPRRFRLPDFVSVAAVVLIGVSVIWPLANQIRNQSIDRGCANRLREVGTGFAAYAGDYGGALPTMMAGPSFWDRAVRHTDNLRPLVDGGYCQEGHLDCPGHDHVGPRGQLACDFSFQWTPPGPTPALGSEETLMPLLADRNPLVDAVLGNRGAPGPLTISLSHRGRGQNALIADGTVIWLSSPVIRRSADTDNIWLPHGLVVLESGVRPASTRDSFLVH